MDFIFEAMRKKKTKGRALLFVISGIDGSGKTTISKEIALCFKNQNLKTAIINLDLWHTAPEIRFSAKNPGLHFYNHAFRFNELFDRLIGPLQNKRSIELTERLIRLPRNDSYAHKYIFTDIDVILLEGIFLLKKELRSKYDFSLWVDCSFERALSRGIARNQEGLSPQDIVRDYQTIYFPAQRIHFERDDPKNAATWVINCSFDNVASIVG